MSGSHDQVASGSGSAGSGGRSGRQGANESCSSCGTTTTPVWRRDGQGGLHCNACSLYIKTKGKPRPIHLESYTVKRRRARPSSTRPAATDETSSSTNETQDLAVPIDTRAAAQTQRSDSSAEARYGVRLSASYPYRERSAERQYRGFHHQAEQHVSAHSNAVQLPMPPLQSLTTSTSMLETRILPPPRASIAHSVYQHRRRESD